MNKTQSEMLNEAERLIFELDEKATPHYWWVSQDRQSIYAEPPDSVGEVIFTFDWPHKEVHKDFVVALRNHAPDLIRAKNARLAAAEGLKEALRAVFLDFIEHDPDYWALIQAEYGDEADERLSPGAIELKRAVNIVRAALDAKLKELGAEPVEEEGS